MGLNKHNPYKLYFRQKLEIYNPHRYGTRFKSGVDLKSKRLGVGGLNGFIGGSSIMKRLNVRNIVIISCIRWVGFQLWHSNGYYKRVPQVKVDKFFKRKKGPFQHNVTY